MIPKYLALVFFFLGASAGVLITVIFAYLKINRLRDERDLKNTRIGLLEKQLEIASKGGDQ